MPRVRYTGGSVYRLRDGPAFAAGDVAGVDDATAERLTARPDFELVDSDGDDAGADGAGFDADVWLDRDYRERAERVTIGEVDAHLDRIETIETSETVRDAVAGRRETRNE